VELFDEKKIVAHALTELGFIAAEGA